MCKLMMFEMVIADDDYPSSTTVSVIHRLSSDQEAMKSLRTAIRDYVKTEHGRKIAKLIGEFNWGDAVTHIPDFFWQGYGIDSLTVHVPVQITVDHDENFWEEDE